MLGAGGVRVRLSGSQRGGGRIKAVLPLICGRWMGLVTRNWGERRRKLPIVGGVACLHGFQSTVLSSRIHSY